MQLRITARSPLARSARPTLRSLVATVLLIVHWHSVGSSAMAESLGDRSAENLATSLPAPVAQMRDMLLAAVAEGEIEALRGAVEWNEMLPSSGSGTERDPIAVWRAHSGDGTGARVLQILGTLLAGVPAVVAEDGKSPRRLVWPAFAEQPADRWTAQNEASLTAFATADEIAAMRRTRRYASWRLVIGEDGTWHAFEWLADAAPVRR